MDEQCSVLVSLRQKLVQMGQYINITKSVKMTILGSFSFIGFYVIQQLVDYAI